MVSGLSLPTISVDTKNDVIHLSGTHADTVGKKAWNHPLSVNSIQEEFDLSNPITRG